MNQTQTPRPQGEQRAITILSLLLMATVVLFVAGMAVIVLLAAAHRLLGG